MDYKEAMAYIHQTEKFGAHLGLERMEAILERLGNPHKALKCIHVAGTNGKGSTTAMLTEILKAEGYKVGMYISPYLEEFEERIQINGEMISKDVLAELVTEIAAVVEEVMRAGYDHPTEFEIITCIMFLYFYREKVDLSVIEVGLGGRLDATNVIHPLVSVITSISLDHMKILGDTIGKIAYEKAGIIKEGVPVVLYPQEKESLEVFQSVCAERKADLVEVQESAAAFLGMEGHLQRLEIKTERDTYEITLSLLGDHQLLNCATVVHVIEVLRQQGITIHTDKMKRALGIVKWPGRLEIMHEAPLVVIDGAHNIDAIHRLKSSIDHYFTYDELVLIIGILADKMVHEMIETIASKAKKVITVTPHSDRAELGKELMEIVRLYNENCECYEDYEDALKAAVSSGGRKDLVLITGSLYMIGDMRKIIKRVYKE